MNFFEDELPHAWCSYGRDARTVLGQGGATDAKGHQHSIGKHRHLFGIEDTFLGDFGSILRGYNFFSIVVLNLSSASL